MAEIEAFYLDPETGFTNAEDIFRKLKAAGYDYTRAQVKEFLDDEETVQRHRSPKQPKFHITAYFNDHKWQADLVDLSSQATTNRNYHWLLTVVDVLSKWAWVIPLKNKTEVSVSTAFKDLIQGSGRSPLVLQTDNGTEFKNKKMRELCEGYGIEQVFNRAGDKHAQGVVERFNRTIMGRIEKYRTANGVNNYVDVLQSLVDNYNKTEHSTIGMSPAEAIDSGEVEPITNEDVKPVELSIGDNVRRMINKGQFAKGYKPNFTSKVYRITGRVGHYYMLNGDTGMWKHNELLRVNHEETPEETKKLIREPDDPKPPPVIEPIELRVTRSSTRTIARTDYKALANGK